jgi:hypothetical protein
VIGEQAKGHLDRPSARRHADDLTGGQCERIKHRGPESCPTGPESGSERGARRRPRHPGSARCVEREWKGSDVTADPEEASGGEFVNPRTRNVPPDH